MREALGDLWAVDADARCVTTNGIVKGNGTLVMGAGIALQARQRFPGIARQLGKWVKENGNIPCYLPEFKIFSLPTKDDWRDDSKLDLIESSLRIIKDMVNDRGLDVIALPLPGCANGNLDWNDVKPILEAILDERFLVVHGDSSTFRP